LYALVLVARHGRDARRQSMPLGPFLAAGAIAALLL
jgi:prepilin signal peptidase PulO-like enzyme (type II secretory pathway)